MNVEITPSELRFLRTVFHDIFDLTEFFQAGLEDIRSNAYDDRLLSDLFRNSGHIKRITGKALVLLKLKHNLLMGIELPMTKTEEVKN